jgi:hypothetical protein
MLGGAAAQNIDAPGFGPNGNTCASRLSVAFNNGGAPISLAIACAVIALWRSNMARLRRSRHATSVQHWARQNPPFCRCGDERPQHFAFRAHDAKLLRVDFNALGQRLCITTGPP